MTEDELTQAILALQDRVLLLRRLHAPTHDAAQSALRRLATLRARRAGREPGTLHGAATPA